MFSLCNQQDFCCCCFCFFAFVFFSCALLKNDESRRRERDKHLSLLLFPSQTFRGFPASFHVAAARCFKACTKPPATSAKPCEVHEECESHLNILCLRLRSESDIMHILKNRGRGARAPSPARSFLVTLLVLTVAGTWCRDFGETVFCRVLFCDFNRQLSEEASNFSI